MYIYRKIKQFLTICLQIGESTFYGLDLVLIDPKSPNTIIVQAFKEEYEYFEHRQLGVCCGSPK